jgi:signal transduction histidine kinase
MTVRFKIALTIVATGLLTALLVVATVLVAFERFERETTFQRASAFLSRVTTTFDNLIDLHERQPQEFNAWMRNLVLYEPDTQLYLLDQDGTVLSSTGSTLLPPGFKVTIAPVRAAAGVAGAAGDRGMPYVMGDDPERMDSDAVIAAQPLRRKLIRADEPVSGYLYLVCHKPGLPASRWEAVRESFALPALVAIVGIVALTTLLAWAVIASVTRPLRRLTEAAASLSQNGLDERLAGAPQALLPAAPRDEFGQLANAFEMLLATMRKQWTALRRLDHFRREAVSNLSHDLRSPLTATVACLETLDGRWAGEAARADDRHLVGVALRNTRNAARLVQSLGDLAKLDEPEFKLRAELVDAGELLDDIRLRFAERASQRGVSVHAEHPEADAPAPFVMLDVELFERAIANLVDNALKFCRPGDRVTLSAEVLRQPGNGSSIGKVQVSVSDTGPGIASADLPHLFDRFFQSRQSVAPATGEGGKGLGLAIVKRIAELHGGEVSVHSTLDHGTRVSLVLPATA